MTPGASSYSAWLAAAIAVHAALLLAHWPVSPPQYSMGASEAVELTLVESGAPANAAPMPLPEPPPPERAPVAPPPEPVSREMPRPLATPRMPRPRSTSPAAAARPNAVPGNGAVARNGGDTRPAYLYNPHPPYPPASRQAGEQGAVVLAVSINERGEVTAVGIKQSSGISRLDDAARTGVARWRFRPGRVAGLPVASKIEVPVRFRLSD